MSDKHEVAGSTPATPTKDEKNKHWSVDQKEIMMKRDGKRKEKDGKHLDV